MSKLRSILEDIETILQNDTCGCNRAELNFSLENLRESMLHKTYTFGFLNVQTQFYASNYEEYDGTTVQVFICWDVFGTHNAAGTYQEGYLDAVDFRQTLANELVRDQLQNNNEHISIINSGLSPLPVLADSQDQIMITLVLSIEAERDM